MSGAGRGGHVTVLTFHGIGEPGPDVPADERPYWCPDALWPSLVDEVADLRASGVPVEVTFDDGNASDVRHALPELLRRGLTATFHACAGRTGLPGYLSAVDLRALREAGMGIGSHGWAHVDLRRAGADELAREADASRRALQDASGGPVERFAIPFGSYDRRVLRALRGYRTVYTSDAAPARAGAWLQPRHSYTRGWTTGTVTALATGAPPAAARVRRSVVTTLKRFR
ncbi:polysaccharide deacetylase family protein [Propioniciclava sp. MC1683]|uniref:polysaccharide deacetylase family protein n=1 Tax=Propioniciclava sp. MC1683 TaxID=2760309 RepID=UPI001601AE14|nr:polysaccharide deacetylase family protein [Propioniciclava sp. MC1683]MBB1501733.1 polysaccharide deacetylase family protein [Propioniciclava sp. MC1683]